MGDAIQLNSGASKVLIIGNYIRAVSAENLLIGEEPDDFHFSRAGEAAAKDSKPIDDFRGSAMYRRAMVKVLTQRSLNIALGKAKENG